MVEAVEMTPEFRARIELEQLDQYTIPLWLAEHQDEVQQHIQFLDNPQRKFGVEWAAEVWRFKERLFAIWKRREQRRILCQYMQERKLQRKPQECVA